MKDEQHGQDRLLKDLSDVDWREEVRREALELLAQRRKTHDNLSRDIILSDDDIRQFIAGLRDKCQGELRSHRSRRTFWRTAASVAALLMVTFTTYHAFQPAADDNPESCDTAAGAARDDVIPAKRPYTVVRNTTSRLKTVRTPDVHGMRIARTEPKHLIVIQDSALCDSLAEIGVAGIGKNRDGYRISMLASSGQVYNLTP